MYIYTYHIYAYIYKHAHRHTHTDTHTHTHTQRQTTGGQTKAQTGHANARPQPPQQTLAKCQLPLVSRSRDQHTQEQLLPPPGLRQSECQSPSLHELARPPLVAVAGAGTAVRERERWRGRGEKGNGGAMAEIGGGGERKGAWRGDRHSEKSVFWCADYNEAPWRVRLRICAWRWWRKKRRVA